jgi:hypothetical protein
MKVIPGTRQADLFGFQSIYKHAWWRLFKERVKRTCLAYKVFIK